MYICPHCREKVGELPEGRVRCPHCGYRLLFKERPPIVKQLKAR
ncbi:MAG TPA: DNA-directed RNA polymerase subunit P [archaeon]|nr:DNA-directed RNA polymerase subunit P [archaeon]HLD80465.1 DNA-directed RNA polymerase subunit P [archaeon]